MATYKVWLTVKDRYGCTKELDGGNIQISQDRLAQEDLDEIKESIPVYVPEVTADNMLVYTLERGETEERLEFELGIIDKPTDNPDNPDNPEEPEGTQALIDKILKNNIAMYSITAEGELAMVKFKVLDGNELPQESGFFVIRGENGKIEKAGYQDLSIVSDELYYIIALPKELDYNTMLTLEAWDPDEKTWVASDMYLISEPSLVNGFCNEVGVDISGIDQDVYTIWVYEDVCTGSILRYVIKE